MGIHNLTFILNFKIQFEFVVEPKIKIIKCIPVRYVIKIQCNNKSLHKVHRRQTHSTYTQTVLLLWQETTVKPIC